VLVAEARVDELERLLLDAEVLDGEPEVALLHVEEPLARGPGDLDGSDHLTVGLGVGVFPRLADDHRRRSKRSRHS
jgi:hypothetical protein